MHAPHYLCRQAGAGVYDLHVETIPISLAERWRLRHCQAEQQHNQAAVSRQHLLSLCRTHKEQLQKHAVQLF
jgi:hypothetical protein